MNNSPAVTRPPVSAVSCGAGNRPSPSIVNSIRINACLDRLATHLQPGKPSDAFEFYNLCLSLSRGIDYSLANGETPVKAQELPALMKQVCQRKNDEYSQAAVMVLMISVKNACKVGWFQREESEELCNIADEIGKIYSSMGNVNGGLSSFDSTISKIMERFYPKLKLGTILASVEAKPGYGASAVDFHITKSTVLADKIWLFVAQTDNIETSASLISPQQVNFLLNGKGVERRTNILMETGPQMPTNVTGMLKFGTNLLQAVGQFNGHYVILVAYMSVTSLPEHPVLQDYVQPAVTSVDSDSDIIEGPSQISLICPISFTRIKTPVKGHLCKHFQCFDFDNYINLNSSRPSWRCPHCNQYVCFTDIRRDRNMAEILENVGENIKDVTVLADGSWKAVLEKDPDPDKMLNKSGNCEMEQTGPKESTCSPSTIPDVFDLTDDDAYLDIMDTSETTDRKPFQAPVQSQFVTKNSTSLGVNSSGVNQSIAAQIDEFWSGVYNACGGSDSPRLGDPVLADIVSPAFNQESEGHYNNPAANSAMHNQSSAPNNLQPLNYMNPLTNEYGISASVPNHIHRTPVAVQALPVQSQAMGAEQNSINNLNSFLQSSSSTAPLVSLSADAVSTILSDTERQQHFSRSPMNLPQVSSVTSPTMQHHSATQNRVPPVNMPTPTQLQNPYRGSSPLSDFRNPHLQQALNSRQHPVLRPSNFQRAHLQHGSQAGVGQAAGATANSQQARSMGSTQAIRPGISQARNFPATGATANSQQARTMPSTQVMRQGSSQAGIFQTARTTANSQQARVMTTAQPTRPLHPVAVSRADELFSLPSEKDWRPTPQMRGSLAGRPCTDEVRQLIIRPTQQAQSSGPGLGSASRPQSSQPVQLTGVSSQLNVLIANNKNAHKST